MQNTDNISEEERKRLLERRKQIDAELQKQSRSKALLGKATGGKVGTTLSKLPLKGGLAGGLARELGV